MGPKPALLSGTDSERLGLIKVQADGIHSLSSTVEASGTVEPSQPSGDENPSGTSAPPKNTEPSTQCNHLQQIHEITTDQCYPSPAPSPPIMVTSNRRLPPPGSLTEGDVLGQYSDSFEGIGNLGPPVHFQKDELCDRFKCQFTEFQWPNAPGRKKPSTNILQNSLSLKSVSQQVGARMSSFAKHQRNSACASTPAKQSTRPFSGQYTRCQLLMKNFIASVQPNSSRLLMSRKASSIFLLMTSPHG